MRTDLDISLAEYKSIQSYKPRIGDLIIWHGWFTHYYGIVNGLDNNKIRIVRSGMPILLLTMNPEDMCDPKNTKMVSLAKIRSSKGAFAVMQGGIWYV